MAITHDGAGTHSRCAATETIQAGKAAWRIWTSRTAQVTGIHRVRVATNVMVVMRMSGIEVVPYLVSDHQGIPDGLAGVHLIG